MSPQQLIDYAMDLQMRIDKVEQSLKDKQGTLDKTRAKVLKSEACKLDDLSYFSEHV